MWSMRLRLQMRPPPPDVQQSSPQTALQTSVVGQGGGKSWILRLFWGALLLLLSVALSLAIWDFTTALIVRFPLLGWIAVGLVGVLVLTCLIMALRELAALSRLSRLGTLRAEAERAQTLEEARAVTKRLTRFYSGRADMRWAQERFAEQATNTFDADAHLAVAEATLLPDLDAKAAAEIEAACRQVATVTAFVPLALADVTAALYINLRMIRRIAEVYGGRGGTLGAWRLTRAVMGHLVATGAVAVGDDLIGSVAGGGMLSKVSRRFGEGIINAALTARVGRAALEVCRPLPYVQAEPPSVTGTLSRGLKGFFGGDGS